MITREWRRRIKAKKVTRDGKAIKYVLIIVFIS